MYSLVSQIDYGDISDLDIYWKSLASSLLKLQMDKWDRPKRKVVSEVLDSIRFIRITKQFKDRAKIMEGLSAKGSSGSFDRDELERLQGEALVFEEEFVDLIGRLRGNRQEEIFV